MILSGRKVFLIVLTIASIIFLKSSDAVFAETVITSDSNTSVSIKNSGNTTGRTDIVIECNGVKKEYHSDKAESVTLNCDDETSGTVKSEVRVNNNSTTPNPTISEKVRQMKEEVEKKKEQIKKEVKAAKDKVENERKDLFEQLTQHIREFLKNLRF